MNIKVLGFLLLLTFGFSTSIYADSEVAKKIELLELPPKAQQIIIEHARGGKIDKIKQQEIVLMTATGRENETFIYLARVKPLKDKKFWIIVSKDGELIDVEDEETEIILEDEAEKKKNKKT